MAQLTYWLRPPLGNRAIYSENDVDMYLYMYDARKPAFTSWGRLVVELLLFTGFYNTSKRWLGMGVLKHQQYVYGKVYKATTTWCFERSLGQPTTSIPGEMSSKLTNANGADLVQTIHGWLEKVPFRKYLDSLAGGFKPFLCLPLFGVSWSNLTVAYFSDGSVNHQLDSPNWSWEYTAESIVWRQR